MSLKVGGDKISNIYIANNLISSIYMGQKCIYNYEIPIEKDNSNEYFYFKIHDPTETTYVGFEKFLRTGKTGGTTEPTVNWSSFTNLVTPTFEYSFDKITWNSYTLGTRISIGQGCAANKVYFRGNNLGRWFDFYQQAVLEPKTDGTEGTNAYLHFFKTWIHSIVSDKAVQCNGNIMSLRYKNFQNQLELPCDYTFVGLFNNNFYLLRGPVLPATTLTNYCYTGMFGDAWDLKQAPILPATIMKDYCYASMFKNCYKLVAAPELPATTLAESCYGSDVYSEELWYGLDNQSATSSDLMVPQGMFGNCYLLINYPLLPATTMKTRCYCGMFYGCTNLKNAPVLASTNLAVECYAHMFHNCHSLIAPPSLPATTLTDGCYYEMFGYCKALMNAPNLSATVMKTECYCNMFFHCESLVTPPSLPGTTLADYCYSGMFAYCISLTSAPSLSATTLAQGCYGTGEIDLEHGSGMFEGCISLTVAPLLSATTLAESCYGKMFKGCTSLTQPPTLPATTLCTGCYEGMFQDSGIVTTPKLSATTLVSNCYGGWLGAGMFQGCKNLTSITKLPALEINSTQAYYSMFQDSNVKASATATSECSYAYRVPTSGTGTADSKSLTNMFSDASGTGNFTPTVNTTFYINVPSF